MTTIRAFFLQIRTLFSNFRKRAGETRPRPPLPTLVTRLHLSLYYVVFGQYAVTAVLTSLINPNDFRKQQQIKKAAAVRRCFSKKAFLEISQDA